MAVRSDVGCCRAGLWRRVAFLLRRWLLATVLVCGDPEHDRAQPGATEAAGGLIETGIFIACLLVQGDGRPWD